MEKSIQIFIIIEYQEGSQCICLSVILILIDSVYKKNKF